VKRTLELNYGRSLKFNKGNYEQDAPMWHEKVTLELNGETPAEVLEIEKREYDALKARIDERADAEWGKIKASLADLRVRQKDGKNYPSVTSIINPEPYTGDPEYGLRGTEVERLINVFIDSGKWEKPTVSLKNLKFEDVRYKEFFEKFGKRIDFASCERQREVFNERYMYSGAIDIICAVDGKPTLADWKTGSWKWRQLIAYQKCDIKVDQLAIFDLKKCVLEVLDLKSDNFQLGWEAFLLDRGAFKARFGL